MNAFLVFVLFVSNLVLANVPTKSALVCGAGGFIGGHLVERLKKEGYWVRGVDIKYSEFSDSMADEFIIADLRNPIRADVVVMLRKERSFDEVYQLAADMGGIGFITCHDAQIMHNSGLINLNVLDAARRHKVGKIFFSSSACIYPERNLMHPDTPDCREETAYPVDPDTEYGWEKIFAERMYQAYARDYGMIVRIARFHNTFGPENAWCGGREKAPAALARKIACLEGDGTVELWGDGRQTRSFMYVDECIEGIRRMMNDSRRELPVLNIGSEKMISINDLALMIADIAGKKIAIKHVKGPQGARGRNSHNTLIEKTLGWAPTQSLYEGVKEMYCWIEEQVKKTNYKEQKIS